MSDAMSGPPVPERDPNLECFFRVVELLKWAKQQGWQIQMLSTGSLDGDFTIGVEIKRVAPSENNTRGPEQDEGRTADSGRDK